MNIFSCFWSMQVQNNVKSSRHPIDCKFVLSKLFFCHIWFCYKMGVRRIFVICTSVFWVLCSTKQKTNYRKNYFRLLVKVCESGIQFKMLVMNFPAYCSTNIGELGYCLESWRQGKLAMVELEVKTSLGLKSRYCPQLFVILSWDEITRSLSRRKNKKFNCFTSNLRCIKRNRNLNSLMF